MWDALLGKLTRLKLIVGAVMALGGALLAANAASAATITVTTSVDEFDVSNPNAECSLREAIESANRNAAFGGCVGDGAFGSDVIVFAPGVTTVTLTNTTATLTGNDDNAYLDLDIVADDASASGGVTLTIDGGTTGVIVQGDPSGWADRIFDVVSSSATTASVVLRNLTIQGGLVPASSPNETGTSTEPCFGGGGGVRNRGGGSLVLHNVTVQTSAAATRGGGVCHQSSEALVVESSRILTNTANVAGGGLWEQAASLVVQNSELRGNTAISGVGGGLATVGGAAYKVISNSLIAFNQAEGDGGGIHSQAVVELRLEDSVVLSNTAGAFVSQPASGGGIWSSGNLVLSNTDVLSNRALVSGTATPPPPPGGGGIYQQADSLHVEGGEISGNEARSLNINVAGGGVWISGTGYFTDTVVEGNRVVRDSASVSAQARGGGIYGVNSALTLTQVLVEANTADGFRANGGGIASTELLGGSSRLVVRESRVVSNTARGDSSVFGSASGGGIEAKVVVLEDAEVSYNLAQGGSAIGGGVASYGALTMTNALVVSNTATASTFGAGGGINTVGQSAFISGTQVLSNTAGRGGGWDNEATSAHMYNSVVRLNRAFYTGPNSKDGGGIYNNSGDALVRSSLIGDNQAGDRGGGAYNSAAGRLAFLDTVIEGNSATNGGGVFNEGRLQVERSAVVGNVVPGAGGGAHNGTGGMLESISSTLRSNSAALGGGLYNGGQAKLAYSALVSNTASSFGGGTYNVAGLESINSTFSGNSAPNGSGLSSVGVTAYLTHTTVASNTGGVGVSVSSGSQVQVAATLLAYNGGGNCDTLLASVGNSLSSDGTCGVAILNTDPLLQPLALNGGPTLNHALSLGSPAINAASACGASDDQRGIPRPQGLACDLGAFERELPDLAVSKSAQPVPALAGQPVTYTVVVTNLSPFAPASGIVLTDALDGDAIFGGVVNSGGFVLSSSTFTQAVFSLSGLPAGASTTLVFTATAPVSGIFTNTVQVASGDVDANPADNVFTITTPVTAAINLRVTKFATPSPALPGQDVFYVVTVKNLGANVATSVVITDVFQGSGAAFVGVSGLSAGVSLQSSSANGVTFTLASLNPLGTAVMIYKVSTSSVGVITNTATASADQAEVDPADNSATVFTPVSHLVINKGVNTASPISGAVAPGGVFTYTLAVTNLGPNTASDITVTDALPAGVGFVSALGFGWTCSESALTVTCTRPTLGVGAAPPIQIVVTAPVTAGLVLTNAATVTSSTYPAVVASNSVAVQVEYRIFVPVARKDP